MVSRQDLNKEREMYEHYSVAQELCRQHAADLAGGFARSQRFERQTARRWRRRAANPPHAGMRRRRYRLAEAA